MSIVERPQRTALNLEPEHTSPRVQSPDSAERCLSCVKDHQRCVRQPSEAKCDRCIANGYACSLGDEDVEVDGKRRKLSKYKCNLCRQRKQKCLPENRSWPDKCERCTKLGLPCSEPQASSKKKDRNGSVIPSEELSDDSDIEGQEASRIRNTVDSEEDDTFVNGTLRRPPLRMRETVDLTSTFRAPSTKPPPARAWRIGVQKGTRFSDVVSTIVQTKNEYEYSPIAENEIRLLLLQPGGADDMIECALVTSSDHEAVYEALSYVWGSNAPACEIRIQRIQRFQGKRSMKNFKRAKHFINENLHSALKCLRDRKRQVALWVDSLCINQDDVQEKSMQVSKMAKIYRRATNVCIWLGESDVSSEAAMKFIPKILDLPHFTATVQGKETWCQWKPLVRLMQRPWFSRLWSIQDIAVAREASVHCGNQVVHWADFSDAVALLHKAKNSNRGFRNYIFDFESLASRDLREMRAGIFVETANNLIRKSDDGSIMERTTSLETLVTTLSVFETSDARDHVYACLSLAKPAPLTNVHFPRRVSLPKAKYDKPVTEVFQEFVKFCIHSSDSLDIICRNWAPASREKAVQELPSWVPPLTGSAFGTLESGFAGRINGDSFVGPPGQPIYHASGLSLPVTTFGYSEWDNYNGTLSVEGFRLDKVSSLGPRNADGLILSESLRMGGWCLPVGGDLPSLVPDRLWRTLVANRGRDGTKYPPSWYHRACLHCLTYAVGTGDINTSELIASPEPILVEFLERVQSVIWNRKFLSTERKDLLGLAPSHAQEGDLVCILFGCSVPVVLRERQQPQQLLASSPSSAQEASADTAARPTSRGLSGLLSSAGSENTYELIGECYIHGMMEGEAFGDDHTSTIKARSETFKLV